VVAKASIDKCVYIDIDSWPRGKSGKVLSAAGLRELAPGMNIDLRVKNGRRSSPEDDPVV
jgi:hypothetical protein